MTASLDRRSRQGRDSSTPEGNLRTRTALASHSTAHECRLKIK